ncbi:MAG: SOUL family heme-binding protein [Verrucomicrobiales bacterium]
MKRIAFLAGAGLGLALLAGSCATSRAGYESAAYSVAKSDGAFQIREYPQLTVVATAMDPARTERDDRFMRLFRYIDGNNAASQKIAMTTPVFMTGENAAAGPAKMAFVVPAAVATAGAPAPKAENVAVESVPARRVAVVRFAGVANRKLEADQLAKLRTWMEAQKLEAAGEPFAAYYDPPWTPGPLRRNEVLVPIKP